MLVHGSIHTLHIRATFEEVCFWEKIITFYLITFGSPIQPRRLHNSHVPIFCAPIWPRERQIHSWKGSFFLKSSCDSQNLLFFWPRTLNGQLAFGWSIIQKLWMVIDWLTNHKYPTLPTRANEWTTPSFNLKIGEIIALAEQEHPCNTQGEETFLVYRRDVTPYKLFNL